MPEIKKFYGKYRGTVLNNADPLKTGRLLVQVADAAGPLPSTWALPCLPFSGPLSGFYVVPAPGSAVWVEFEHGDLDKPVWTGCFWGSTAEVPALALAGAAGVQQVVIQTTTGNSLMISDTPGPAGGILLTVGTARISVSQAGITISNGQGAVITMTGNTVAINGTALVVA